MRVTEAIAIRLRQVVADRLFFNALSTGRNLSQYFLFKNGGVPRSTVCDVINNKKKRVSTETVYQICSTLGLSLSEFFNDPVFDNLED